MPPTLLSTVSISSSKSPTPPKDDLIPSSPAASSSSEDEDSSSSSNEPIVVPVLEAGGRVSQKFINNLVSYYVQQRRLPTSTVLRIIKDSKSLFSQQPSLVDIRLGMDDKVNVCGDIHGQFFDLVRIFELFGQPSERNQVSQNSCR